MGPATTSAKVRLIAVLYHHLGQDDVVAWSCIEHQVEGASRQKQNLIVDGLKHCKPCWRGRVLDKKESVTGAPFGVRLV